MIHFRSNPSEFLLNTCFSRRDKTHRKSDLLYKAVNMREGDLDQKEEDQPGVSGLLSSSSNRTSGHTSLQHAEMQRYFDVQCDEDEEKNEEACDSPHENKQKEQDGHEEINYWHDEDSHDNDPDNSDHLDDHHDNEDLFQWMTHECNTRQDLLTLAEWLRGLMVRRTREQRSEEDGGSEMENDEAPPRRRQRLDHDEEYSRSEPMLHQDGVTDISDILLDLLNGSPVVLEMVRRYLPSS